MEEELVNDMLLKPKNTIEINKNAKYYSKMDMDYFYSPETFINNVNNPLMNPFHSIHGNTYGVFPSGYVKKDSYNHNLTLTNNIINKIKEENIKLERQINEEEVVFEDFYNKYISLMIVTLTSNTKYIYESNNDIINDIINDLKNAINTNSKLTLFRKYNVSNIEELKDKYNQHGGSIFDNSIDIEMMDDFINNNINDKYKFNKYMEKMGYKDGSGEILNYDKMIENAYNKYMNIKG